jgi:hypothetical protein
LEDIICIHSKSKKAKKQKKGQVKQTLGLKTEEELSQVFSFQNLISMPFLELLLLMLLLCLSHAAVRVLCLPETSMAMTRNEMELALTMAKLFLWTKLMKRQKMLNESCWMVVFHSLLRLLFVLLELLELQVLEWWDERSFLQSLGQKSLHVVLMR